MRAEAHFRNAAPPRPAKAVGGAFRFSPSASAPLRRRSLRRFAPITAGRIAFAVFAAGGAWAAAPELTAPPDRVLAAVAMRYAAVSNLSCTVRRSARMEGAAETPPDALSKIVWARGGRLNVKKLAPEARRTVIDGAFVRTAAENDPEPVAFPVAEQLPTQAANLRSVPGSPEESLYALDPESAREADVPHDDEAEGAGSTAVRAVAFSFKRETAMPPNAHAVVAFDAAGTVLCVDTHAGNAPDAPRSTTRFRSPVEPIPGVVLFRRIETRTSTDGQKVVSTVAFERISVNSDLPPDTFDPVAVFGEAGVKTEGK